MIDIHIRGVPLVISKEKANTLLEWEPISDRVNKARFNSKHCKVTIILCYTPTNESDKEDKFLVPSTSTGCLEERMDGGMYSY